MINKAQNFAKYSFILLALLNIIICDAPYTINEETKIKPTETALDGVTINSGKLFVGSGNESLVEQTNVFFDLQEDQTILGAKSLDGWGIDCAKKGNESSNSCSYNPADPFKNDKIYGQDYTYIQGAAYLKLEQDSKIKMGETFFVV